MVTKVVAKIKAKPIAEVTMNDVVNALDTMANKIENHQITVRQLYEEHQEQDAQSFEDGRRQFQKLEAKIDTIEERQKNMADAFGLLHHEKDLPDSQIRKKTKPIGLMSQSEVIWKAGSGIAAIFAIWKFIGFTFPYAIKFLVDLNTMILN